MLRNHLRTVLFAALALAVAGQASTQQAHQVDRANRLCVRGLRHLQAGRVEQARAAFLKAQESAPGLAAAADGLARVALHEGRYERALQGFITAAQRYESAVAAAARRRAEAAEDLQKVQTAYRDYGVKNGPGCSDRLAGQSGQDPASLLDPTEDPLPAGLRFRIGVCLLHLGRVGEARGAFRAELERHPDSAVSHVNLAVCELELGDPSQALVEVQAARRLGAKVPDGLEHDIRAKLP